MSNPSNHESDLSRNGPRSESKLPAPVRSILIGAGKVIVRLYALAVLLVVVWAGYTAVAYLVRSLFYPIRVPPHILQWQTPIDVDMLDAGLPAEAATPLRAPFDHFHGVGRLFQSDRAVGCSTGGCHGPLPHTKRKEIRAFANLHTTFMTCRICHAAEVEGPARAMWVHGVDGSRAESPVILQLIRLLETEADEIESDPFAVHPRILEMLGQTVALSGGDRVLDHLMVQIETSEPGRPAWRHAVAQLVAELPNHTRGEYGIKLSPDETEAQSQQFVERMGKLAGEFFDTAPNSRRREEIYRQIHEKVLAEPSGCLACHGGDPPRLDFEALGYPAGRAAHLRSAPIAKLMQHIRDGQPFYLPTLLEDAHAR